VSPAVTIHKPLACLCTTWLFLVNNDESGSGAAVVPITEPPVLRFVSSIDSMMVGDGDVGNVDVAVDNGDAGSLLKWVVYEDA